MSIVVIIGAGPCGLVALKELLEAGHKAIILESSHGPGGVFASPTAYDDLHLTVSNWFMAFSDFPDPSGLHYPSAIEYVQYLKAYIRHFRLDHHVRYNSEVTRATLVDGTRWCLEVHQPGQDLLKMDADALIVATGASQVPNLDVPGLKNFTGQVFHLSQCDKAFKSQVASQKLRVLVVGAGESGADLAPDLADVSPHVKVWVRRLPCIGPRYMDNSLTETEHITLNKAKEYPATGFLEASTTNRMSSGINVFLYGLFRRFLWNLPGVNETLRLFNLGSTASAPLRTEQATYVTKNSRMVEAVSQGKLEVIVRPNLASAGRTCQFSYGDTATDSPIQRDFDAVVLCTGYRLSFPWLEIPDQYGFTADPRTWFLHCLPKSLAHCLFFVGYARPHQGGLPVAAEMLSRYIALLLRGDGVPLPTDYGSQALADMKAEREYYSISPDLHSLVDYSAYVESLARRVGCEPRLPWGCTVLFNLHLFATFQLLFGSWIVSAAAVWIALATWIGTLICFFAVEDGILIKWWFLPHWSVWYRLRGPGADPGLVYSLLARVPLRTATELTPYFIVFSLWTVLAFYIQRAISFLIFIPAIVLRKLGLGDLSRWFVWLRPKQYVLHNCPWRFSDLFLP
ncbi:hypothetical protein F5Y17DRAFT_421190 [Xylariaceae sp. FL0594]|nr:hypothetical protein F5Y17DRAFT_421190 [Xylariaceae sp. FL0594]